jgi:hypothetical protein
VFTKLLMAVPGVSQSAGDGALPTLLAATGPEVRGGDHLGPSRHLGMVGPPGPARLPRRALDEQAAAALWTAAEDLTGVTWAPAALASVG